MRPLRRPQTTVRWKLTLLYGGLFLACGAGLQETARIARYAALAEAAAESGFLHLLLGHHAADQAETVQMRAARGPGGAEGIAAWIRANRDRTVFIVAVIVKAFVDQPLFAVGFC